MVNATIEGELVKAIQFEGTWDSARDVQRMGVMCDAIQETARPEDTAPRPVWLTFLTSRRGLSMAAPGEVVVLFPDNSWVSLHPATFQAVAEVVND